MCSSVLSQVFNLTSDPDENINLAVLPENADLVRRMETLLLAQVDYPKVRVTEFTTAALVA